MKKTWVKYALITLIAFALIRYIRNHAPQVSQNKPEAAETTKQNDHSSMPTLAPTQVQPPVATITPTEIKIASPRALQSQLKAATQKTKPQALHFVVAEDGLVTVDADIVLGRLQNSDATSGLIAPPTIQLWHNGYVPYHIQGHFENTERIQKALEMFEDAPLRLVPQNDEADMIVFEPVASGCKSYVGRVGGRQPIWIGPECGPREIAHEIMHSLGFIHEQNRSDRDAYVKIYWNNILPDAKVNFEQFPDSMMLVSGQAPFDYRSIMIYSPTMFAKNNSHETMEPTDKRSVIEPSEGLTLSDLIRLDKVYSRKNSQ